MREILVYVYIPIRVYFFLRERCCIILSFIIADVDNLDVKLWIILHGSFKISLLITEVGN